MAKKKEKIDATFRDWLGEEVGEMPRFQLIQGLDQLFEDGPNKEDVEAAQSKLLQSIEEQLPPIIYYSDMQHWSLGKIWIAKKGSAIVAISYDETEADFLRFLAKLIDGRYVHSAADLSASLCEVDDYLNSATTSFASSPDLSSITKFQRLVLEETLRIPRGQISTYGEIAIRIGKPKASRAVGQALRRNPIPIMVPCHRVVASDGTLGGYAGQMGDERKTHLLKLEGVVFA